MVEIIPKKQAGEIPFSNIFLFAAGALLLTAVFGYVIVIRINAGLLNNLNNLEDNIAQLGTRDDRVVEARVFDTEKMVKNFAVLLASRRKSSNFFENFASLIHPRVWLSELDLDAANLKASVSGESPNFKILEQQLIFLRNQENFIESLELSKATIGKDGKAEFKINFNFKPEIFN